MRLCSAFSSLILSASPIAPTRPPPTSSLKHAPLTRPRSPPRGRHPRLPPRRLSRSPPHLPSSFLTRHLSLSHPGRVSSGSVSDELLTPFCHSLALSTSLMRKSSSC